jgi:hypothetical protein
VGHGDGRVPGLGEEAAERGLRLVQRRQCRALE